MHIFLWSAHLVHSIRHGAELHQNQADGCVFFTAVINGILAPFVLVGVLLVACDSVIMNRQTSSWVARVAVAITTIGMFFAAGAIFL